ncbi:GNAT family N-acetyltransferase [Rossellomorea vietnamensis]|uniref:GNAT family N-acetyltransferase n=1 Tax=Rossellomorea vietnamensis TaxID=218284 RepID=UPI001E29F25D|nr:GNAT family N-acetyltransferase [Rossellomorea vietnamensis]MCC5801197.1 GNAT family N-acetyltransferase [Rossellomorea vietnamensis]
MEIRLEKAIVKDAPSIYDLQVKSFMPLLERYKDYETNPANEDIEKVQERIIRPDGGFYKILMEDRLVGAICVYWKEDVQFTISPMFILPSYQGRRIAQKTILLVEEMFPLAHTWELATLLEEKRNCYLYEKMGYTQTGIRKKLNEDATLIFYKKVVSHGAI